MTSVSLDYLSPLPPRRTGIAEYSVDLLPELATRCDLRVVRLGEDGLTPELEERWQPASFSALGDDGRLPLYQMGNNRNHVAVYEAASRLPGVLTLHDLVLHHFHQERLLIDEDFDGYRERLRTDHGWIGDAVAMPIRWTGYSESAVFALPAHRELLRAQRGILVHSKWSAGVIEEEVPEIRVRTVPMGIPLPPAVDPERGLDFRRRHGLPETAPLLGSFGFQTPIKRTEIAIRALARPELSAAHLVVVGEAAPILDLEGEAAAAGVADRVHVLGYVAFEELEAAIGATDLCLNLRYPTAGETSASLLRVFALGCPAIVSNYAQFAELPDDFAIKVPLGDQEVEVLAARVGSLLAMPERLRTLGQAARDHVARENRPAIAAQAVVEACSEWRHLDPPVLAEGGDSVVPAPSSVTVWPRGTIQLSAGGDGEDRWHEGSRRRVEFRLTNSGPSRWLASERGDGGLALAVEVLDASGKDWFGDQPWIRLPTDVEPSGSLTLTVDLRRPLGPTRIRAALHCLGWDGREAVASTVLEVS